MLDYLMHRQLVAEKLAPNFAHHFHAEHLGQFFG